MSEKEMLQNVIVSSPSSVEKLYNVIQSLKDANLKKHNVSFILLIKNQTFLKFTN